MKNNIFMSDTPTIFLDGNDVRHLQLCLVERPLIPTPERKQVVNESMYSDRGSYRENTGWEDIQITVKLNYLEDVELTSKTFRMAFTNIRATLLNTQRIQFNDEVDVYYTVKGVSIGNAINTIVEYGEFDVTFTCSPFGSVADEYEDEQILEISSQVRVTSFRFINDGLYTAYPKITLRGYSGRPIYILMKEVDENGNVIPNGKTNWDIAMTKVIADSDIIVDSEKALLYTQNRTTGKIQPITSESSMLNFPKLISGTTYELSLGSLTDNIKVGVTVERNRVI